jgi:predicted amidohydrolase
MNVAAVQFFATPFALERNLQTAERLIREAARNGMQVVVLPELFNTGYVYTPRLFAAAEEESGPTVQWLKRLSTELNILIGGAMLMREDKRFYDVFVLAEPDGLLHKQRKRHPFIWEHCFFESGQETSIFTTRLGKISLLICWDTVFRSAWEPFRGKVDLVLVSSAPPRFHRAILNFPEARKVYLAELNPQLLPYRDAMDNWYTEAASQGAAFVGAPVVHSLMSGRFVTGLPFPRLSFGLSALGRPKYLSWTSQADKATLRATFYGESSVFSANGEALAKVAADEGWAGANIGSAVTPPPQSSGASSSKFMVANVPTSLGLFDSIFRSLGRLYINEHTR